MYMIDIPFWVFLGNQMRMRWMQYVAYMRENCMDCFGLGEGQVVGCCEHGNETFTFH